MCETVPGENSRPKTHSGKMTNGVVLNPKALGEALKINFDFPVPYGPFIVGLRGAEDRGGRVFPVAVDHLSMRCRILAMSCNGQRNGFRIHQNLRGTTAPGLKWLRNPMNPAGTAMVAPGRHKAHKRGLHKGKPALQQCGSLVVWRDSNRDARLTPADSFGTAPAECRMNIHASVPFASLIGGHSAGCIVPALGFGEQAYKNFLERFHPTQEIVLFILPFELLVRAWEESSFHCLMIGSQGDLVRKLQVKLGTVSDGDFGINTARALIKFQTTAGIRADGICGPQTMKAIRL